MPIMGMMAQIFWRCTEKVVEYKKVHYTLKIDQPAIWTENEGWFQEWEEYYP